MISGIYLELPVVVAMQAVSAVFVHLAKEVDLLLPLMQFPREIISILIM